MYPYLHSTSRCKILAFLQRNYNVISTCFRLTFIHLEEDCGYNVIMVGMQRYNQNKIDGLGTWPEFEKEMHFYVPVGVIIIELEDCSDYATGIEYRNLLHDETDFLSGSNYMVSQILLCIRYDETWAEILSGNSRQ